VLGEEHGQPQAVHDVIDEGERAQPVDVDPDGSRGAGCDRCVRVLLFHVAPLDGVVDLLYIIQEAMNPVKHTRSANTGATRAALHRYRREYARLKRQLRDIGYICLGSVYQRWQTCGTPSCACHSDPQRRHGPYYQWTRKVNGRTEARLLDASLVRLYQEGIRNHQRLDAIVKKMQEVSLAAFEAAKTQAKP
jgi:hypothetical protein